MTLTAVLRRMKIAALPHGFRSTFKDWVSELTNYPNELSEMALAHAIGSKVEAAYRRGDMFDRRRNLMDEWAAFCNCGNHQVRNLDHSDKFEVSLEKSQWGVQGLSENS